MQNAEMVTFGGGGLDRAGHLRRDAEAVAALLADPDTRVLAIWRGKPALVTHEGGETAALALHAPGHPVFAAADAGPVLIGLRPGGGAIFARDISGWEPEALGETFGTFFDTSRQVHPALAPGESFAELRAHMAQLTPLEAEIAATGRAILGWHETHGHCARCGERSELAMAGWQRNCPVCKAQHFPRTDPVVIMLITHGNAVLVGRNAAWPEGMYSLLAGFVEPGETLEAAVRREVMEESGVPVGRVDYLASQPWPFPSSLMFGCQGLALDRAVTVDPTELESAIWVSREEMAEVFAGTHAVIRKPRQGAIAEFLLRNWLADRLD